MAEPSTTETSPKDETNPGGNAGCAASEGDGKPGVFQRLLNWLIRGAERSRRDPGRCPT